MLFKMLDFYIKRMSFAKKYNIFTLTQMMIVVVLGQLSLAQQLLVAEQQFFVGQQLFELNRLIWNEKI